MIRSETAGNNINRSKFKDPKYQTFTKITQIQDDENILSKRISMLKEKQNQLDSEIKSKQAQLDLRRKEIIDQKRADKSQGLKVFMKRKKLKQEMNDTSDKVDGGGKQTVVVEETKVAPLEGDAIKKQLKSYQAMIDNMLKQQNEYDAKKKHLKLAVEQLRREKGLFQKILRKLRDQLAEVCERAEQMEEEEKQTMDRLQDEMKSLVISKRSAVFESKRFGKEFSKVYHYFESENDKDRFTKKYSREQHDDVKLDDPRMNNMQHSNYGSLDYGDSPSHSKRKNKINEKDRKKNETNFNEKNLIELRNDVERYDNTFKQLMEETKTKHINEILQTFADQEEENYGLFKYLHGLSDDLERLLRQKDNLLLNIKDLEDLPRRMQNDPKIQKQNLLNQEISSIKDRRQHLSQKHKDFMKILQSLRVSIPIMFERIGCFQEDYMQILGENFNFKDIDEDGIVKLLGVIEKRTNDILQMQNDASEGRPGFLGQNGNLLDAKNQKILEESNQSVQGNQEEQFFQKLGIYEKQYKEPEANDTKQLFQVKDFREQAEKEFKDKKLKKKGK